MSAYRDAVRRHFTENPFRFHTAHMSSNREQRREGAYRQPMLRPAEDSRRPSRRHTLGIPKATRKIIRRHRPLIVGPGSNFTYRSDQHAHVA